MSLLLLFSPLTNTTAYSDYRLFTTAVLFGAGTSLAEMELALTPGGADTTAGMTFTADSSFDGSTTPDKGFDDNPATFWASGFGGLPAWLRAGYGGSPVAINELAITARNDASGPDQTPRDFVLAGTNDGIAWTPIITRTGVVWTAGQRQTFLADPATSAVSMTADVGIFTYSGQATQLERGYAMAAGLGTFTYSGQASLLERGYSMPGAVGTFTYAGQAALLERGYTMAAGQATFSYTGQAAGLVAAYRMAAGLGTFSYNGQAALLERGYSMPATVGTFTYAGQAAALLPGVSLVAAVGTFTYSGQAALLALTVSMPAGLGSFNYAGQPTMATLSYGSVPPSGGGGSSVKVTAFFYRP